jgi:hypothetical protein
MVPVGMLLLVEIYCGIFMFKYSKQPRERSQLLSTNEIYLQASSSAEFRRALLVVER